MNDLDLFHLKGPTGRAASNSDACFVSLLRSLRESINEWLKYILLFLRVQHQFRIDKIYGLLRGRFSKLQNFISILKKI